MEGDGSTPTNPTKEREDRLARKDIERIVKQRILNGTLRVDDNEFYGIMGYTREQAGLNPQGIWTTDRELTAYDRYAVDLDDDNNTFSTDTPLDNQVSQRDSTECVVEGCYDDGWFFCAACENSVCQAHSIQISRGGTKDFCKDCLLSYNGNSRDPDRALQQANNLLAFMDDAEDDDDAFPEGPSRFDEPD